MGSIGNHSLELISKIVVGDDKELFPYITGPQIVAFFNDRFGYQDVYQYGNAPTRWRYAAEKITDMLSNGRINEFFSAILSPEYMMTSWECDEIPAREKAENARQTFNRIIRGDGLELVGLAGDIRLVEIDSDLVLIGEGGFARAYRQISTGRVLKKLKPDMTLDERTRHRFKREFEIMKRLCDVPGVLRVYEYNGGSCSYTMEAGEKTLSEFMSTPLSEQVKLTIIKQVVATMSDIHNRGYIHRDLSPTNIFVLHGALKIADFGLGKNLDTLSSYQTADTNNYGQLFYCSPEQLVYLRDGDKRSDVFALGRLINYILTEHPTQSTHRLRSIVEKATAHDPNHRYQDATELLGAINKKVALLDDESRQNEILDKIQKRDLDAEVVDWILDQTGEQLCKMILSTPGIKDAVIKIAETNEVNAGHIIDSIGKNMEQVCKTWEDNDPFSEVAKAVILSKATFDVKERACCILAYTARYVNRFSAQHLIDEVLAYGIDPMLEDILNTSPIKPTL